MTTDKKEVAHAIYNADTGYDAEMIFKDALTNHTQTIMNELVEALEAKAIIPWDYHNDCEGAVKMISLEEAQNIIKNLTRE